MVKYILYGREIGWSIASRLESYQEDNEYNKVIMEFDSSDMEALAQLNHSIIKIKHSVTGKVYSEDIETNTQKLIEVLNKREDLIEFDDYLEPLFLKALLEEITVTEVQIREFKHNVENYKVKLEALKLVKKSDISDDNLHAKIEDMKEKVDLLKPITRLLNQDFNNVCLYVNTNNLYLEIPIISIKRTEDGLKLIFDNGYLDINKDSKVDYEENPYDYCEQYEFVYAIQDCQFYIAKKVKYEG